jgi:hypothetical protein
MMAHSKRSRRRCTCEYGLQSWRGESAGVAKRPRERPPTRNSTRYDSPTFDISVLSGEPPTRASESYVSEQVTYKAAVQHWEARQMHSNALLPRVIQACQGGMTPEEFAGLRTDPTFLYRCANVCESCCLDHNETVLAGLSCAEASVQGGRDPPLPFPSLPIAKKKRKEATHANHGIWRGSCAPVAILGTLTEGFLFAPRGGRCEQASVGALPPG